MKLIKINSNLLVNPDKISFIEQKNNSISISIDGRMVNIDSEDGLKEILKEIYQADDNLWGSQHWRG